VLRDLGDIGRDNGVARIDLWDRKGRTLCVVANAGSRHKNYAVLLNFAQQPDEWKVRRAVC
jgi:hypothetical protein